MSKKLYHPEKRNGHKNKEKTNILDKVEIAVITIATIALVGWSIISIIPKKPVPTYQIYTDGISQYMYNVDKDMTQKILKEKEDAKRKAEEEAKKEIIEKKEQEELKKRLAEEKAKKEMKRNEKKLEEKQDTKKQYQYTATASLNIRMKPEETSKSLGQFQKGDIINVIEENKEHDGWYKIRRDKIEGYISSKYVEKK